MVTMGAMAQGVIDVHSHIITPEFVSALEKEGRLLDEGFPLPKWDTEAQLKEDSTQIRILEIYASQEAYQHHIQTAHFQKYKQGTLHMVKSLKLQDLSPLSPETMDLIFKKQSH